MGVSTKTGDKGKTSLFTGERVDKDCLRVEAYGLVDEVNSVLGMARANCKNEEVKSVIFSLQKMNMSMMAELASTGDASYITDEAHIAVLDSTIDTIEAALPPLTAFLIAGDSVGGAALDLARTTIRRAERAVWRLNKTEPVRPQVLVALNRESDLCFLLMRKEEL